MKIYNLPALADATPNGEYVLGPDEAQTSGAYIVYGRLRPGQTGHRVSKDHGHEEIICVVKGELKVRCGKKNFDVSAGEAFNPGAGAELTMDNTGPGEAIFISARSRACASGEKDEPARKETAPSGAEEPATQPEPDETHHDEPDENEFEITNDGIALED